jgi:transposase-like protein
VSALCQQLDPLVSAWNERSLAEQRYPFVLLDALVVKVREDGRVRSRSALVAIGVSEAGYREILGLQLGDSESERSWMAFFVWLKSRGLSGVDLVVSDHHRGLVNALRLQFQGATWQRCQTHLSANVTDATPRVLQEAVHRRVRAIFEAPDTETARLLLAAFCTEVEHTAPAAVATFVRGFDDATAILALPDLYRTSTAPLPQTLAHDQSRRAPQRRDSPS